MKVILIDHPKLISFLLRVYYRIPKLRQEQL